MNSAATMSLAIKMSRSRLRAKQPRGTERRCSLWWQVLH